MEANGLILRNISGYIHLNDQETSFFISLLKPLKFKRKEMLLAQGEICRFSSFVIDGCLRDILNDENGLSAS